ncbi:endo-1,4-beta-xylanase [Solirubrobacter soli]|uniref:endo-1,4-beta-xylanase n=1 Tax=Solirubrobacter soli TaxID=363832 RepID=UPI00041FF4C4|nr:endo-1,4-beta-xylanase [Solirubrobacter soli]
MYRAKLAVAVSMMSASVAAPALAEDKFLGSVNDFTNPLFAQYFDQVTPENAGKWGSAAGTTRTAAMRWTALDQAYTFAKTNGFGFNFHVLLWGNQQPTWMATLPPEEQLIEIKKWFAAVAARYPAIDWLQVVNEATWDPPDGSVPKNAGANFASSGNYVQALGGANGTDGTGYDWILNAFRLARQYFPNTKLMLNDVAITGMTAATDEYLKIINILKRENLIDVVGLQAHAFEFIPNNPNVPSIPGHPYQPVTDMAVHKANLDRLAATGVPIQLTELDLDGFDVDGVPGDEMQLRYYRQVFPTFWEHPSVKGVTLWGWRQPNHWRNAQNAPIFLSNGTLKPAAQWLFAYVNGIAPVIKPAQTFTVTDVNAPVGVVQADDWASQIGRTNLRTFSWSITGGTGAGIFSIAPGTGELRVADQRLLDEHASYSLRLRVSDGFNTSDEVAATVTTGELANVVHADVGASVPATLSLTLGAPAGFGAFTPGVTRDYTASTSATVTSSAGDAALTFSDPGHLLNGTFALPEPLVVSLSKVAWPGPASNDPVTIDFKQHIGAADALRTGAYSRTLTFTLSTTAP